MTKEVKSYLTILITVSFSLVNLTGCATVEKKSDFVIQATQYLAEYSAACKAEKSQTWNQSLCVPVIIVDPKTKDAVSSEPDPSKTFQKYAGAYHGQYYGAPFYANTSVKWGDRNWSMLVWPLPQDSNERQGLLFHEAFHSIQDSLGLLMNNALATHLDRQEARVLIRLEWNSLMRALEEPERRVAHLQVALEMRRQRFEKFAGAQHSEESLEMNEGLAEYTGIKLRGSDLSETYAHLKQKLVAVSEVFSLTRSAAYYSGALYGLLLDIKDPQWTSSIAKVKSLSQMTAQVFDVKAVNSKKLSLKQYGYGDIVKFERQRAASIKARIKDYLRQIESPGKLEITLNRPQAIFNPYGVLSVNSESVIYETFEVKDDWGSLKVLEGILAKFNGSVTSLILSPPIEITPQGATGAGWALSLNPDWEIIKLKNRAVIYKKQQD